MKRFAIMLLLAAAIPAHAAKKSGVELPDTVQVGDKTLVLNGLGLREATVFNVNVYVAGLWVEAKSSDGPAIAAANSPKRLDLVFVRDVDRDDIVEAFTGGFKKNGGDMAKLKDRIAQLNGWMPDLKKKDVLSFTYVPGTGLSVSVKGQVKGTVPGEDFQSSFFRIWLGPEPPNKGLKKGLLGQ